MNMRYMSCLALSLVFVVPSLVGAKLYNNTIYPVDAVVTLGGSNKETYYLSLGPGDSADIEAKGTVKHVATHNTKIRSRTAGLPPSASIEVTVPSEVKYSPIWQDGKVGGTAVGSKAVGSRQEQSAVFYIDQGGRTDNANASFVINANRTPSFSPDFSAVGGSGPVEIVQNLAIYRFIQ